MFVVVFCSASIIEIYTAGILTEIKHIAGYSLACIELVLFIYGMTSLANVHIYMVARTTSHE